MLPLKKIMKNNDFRYCVVFSYISDFIMLHIVHRSPCLVFFISEYVEGGFESIISSIKPPIICFFLCFHPTTGILNRGGRENKILFKFNYLSTFRKRVNKMVAIG